MENLFIHIFDKGTMMTSKSAVAVKIPVEAKKEQKKNDPGAEAALRADLAKFLMNRPSVSVDKSSKSGDKSQYNIYTDKDLEQQLQSGEQCILKVSVTSVLEMNLAELHQILQCWTVGPIFDFGRSQMFSPEKIRPLAVDRSRSHRIKKSSIHVINVDQQTFKPNR